MTRIDLRREVMVWAVAVAALFTTASAHAQMVCGADDAENLRLLQAMNGSEADLAQALLAAANRLQPRSVVWLLEKGVPVDSHDDRGGTPLIYLVLGAEEGEADPYNRERLPRGVKVVPWPCATERQGAERAILDALLRRSPDLESRNSAGFTALLIAAKRMRFDLVLALQDAGANINAALPSGTTAIFFAPRSALKSLVKAGADINAANSQGDTILHQKMSSLGGQRLIDFVDTAIRLGARDSRNQRGEWASEVAVDSISFLEMGGGIAPLDKLRKRLKATRTEE